MTSVQSWSRRHHWLESTSSMPIFKRLCLVIYKILTLVFPVNDKEGYELYLYKDPNRNMNIYLAKLSRFESADFASVMIDGVGCSRRHMCPQCDIWLLSMHLAITLFICTNIDTTLNILNNNGLIQVPVAPRSLKWPTGFYTSICCGLPFR